MRLMISLFAGFAALSGGCTTVPTVMGIGADDSVPLSTREQVHYAFGVPVAVGTIDGTRYEEFLIQDGFNSIAWNLRVPAYQPLEEMHIYDPDLKLIAINGRDELPVKGKNLIVLAVVNNVLIFRLFNDGGTIVVDTDETKLTAQAEQLAELKRRLGNLWPDHTMTDEENYQIISIVALLLARTPPGSFEIGVGTVKHCGPLFRMVQYPAEDGLSRRRIHSGQTLHFEFDNSEKVTKVSVDGDFLLLANNRPNSTTTPAQNGHGFIMVGCLPAGLEW